jgi:hypothetical protein
MSQKSGQVFFNDERFCPVCRKWAGEPWSVRRDYEPDEGTLWLEVPPEGASLIPVLRPLCRECASELSVCATCRFWAGAPRIAAAASRGHQGAVAALLRIKAACRQGTPPWGEKTSATDLCGAFELGIFALSAEQIGLLHKTGRKAVMLPRFWTKGDGCSDGGLEPGSATRKHRP